MSLEERVLEVGREMARDLEKVPAFARAPIERNLNRIMMLVQVMAHKIDRLEDESCQSR